MLATATAGLCRVSTVPLVIVFTALDVFYTTAPTSTRYGASTEKARSLPGSTGYTVRYTSIDPNTYSY